MGMIFWYEILRCILYYNLYNFYTIKMYKMYNVIQPAAGGFFLRFWTPKTAFLEGKCPPQAKNFAILNLQNSDFQGGNG